MILINKADDDTWSMFQRISDAAETASHLEYVDR